ncbi:hypothetical protein BYT27DRAFT_7186828 [Phlegmacium glaucopus]|nr:hypothetical protein BYT27DRAFT_7186828 [Phlegmacium glaucopus]
MLNSCCSQRLKYLWACVTGKLRSYSSQPMFTSIHRKTRPFPLPFRSRLQPRPE